MGLEVVLPTQTQSFMLALIEGYTEHQKKAHGF